MGSCTSRLKVDNKGNARSGSASWKYSYDELAAASNNFSDDCLLGRGGYGSVYVGKLKRTGQIVAIKKLHNDDSHQRSESFHTEAVMSIELRHPNLVSLIGLCDDGAERLLVLEYMPLGSLDDHLFRRNSRMVPLDWNARMKIALCVAQGLEYLHLKHDPPVIHRDLKCSNILLGEGYHAKLSDFGLAKEGPAGDKPHVKTAVVGTDGYIAPEYASTHRLTAKSDIYGFGVVLLEIITGRRAVDDSSQAKMKELVVWALPYIEHENSVTDIADPSLRGKYLRDEFAKVAVLAARCVQLNPDRRPQIDEIVYELTNLSEPSTL